MMFRTEGNLHALTGGLRVRARVQHPRVTQRKDRPGWPWIFRYYDDEVQADGSTKVVRRYQEIAPSKGDGAIAKKQGEVERDKFLAMINKPTIQEKVADGLALFTRMVDKYKAAHVEAQVAGRFLLAKPTREKYLLHLEQRI